MPIFKVRHVDGSLHQVTAQRLSSSAGNLHFESLRGGSWVSCLTVASDDVDEVRQRVTELNGSHRWGPARVTDRRGA